MKETRTLSPFVLELPGVLRELHCPVMELHVGRDREPPAFVGDGTLHLTDPTSLRWTMNVTVSEAAKGFGCLAEAKGAPHDPKRALRLEAVDYRGRRWNCGWTVPEVRPEAATHARLYGSLESLVKVSSGLLVAIRSSVELYFEPVPSLPLSEPMVTSIAIGEERVAEKCEDGREVFDVLGSRIEISRDPLSAGIWVIATTSEGLPHPYLENWASEPLRILCGQLVYPRLVARNFGDGTAHVWLRRTCLLGSRVGGVRSGFDPPHPASFWSFYRQCLEFLAKHRDTEVQANLLGRFHEEVIQAAGSSDWVLSLAASSAIEGLCRLAAGAHGLPRDFNDKSIKEAKSHLQGTPGPPELRQRLLSSLANMGQPSVRRFLGTLVERQVISAGQRDAWVAVRNKVAHGRLDGAGSAQDDDRNLVLLLELLNALTKHVVTTRE